MTHKSKISLIVLCLLGMAFSYSCTCRSSSYDPKYWSASKVYSTGTYKSVESIMDDDTFYLYVKITEGSGDEGMTIEYKPADGTATPNFDGTEASKLEIELRDGIYTGHFERKTDTNTVRGNIFWGEDVYIIISGTGQTLFEGKKISLKKIE